MRPTRALRARFLVLLVTIAAPLAGAARGEPCAGSAGCGDRFELSTGKTLAYYASFPLARNDAIERVVIVVHGNLRDADAYFDRLVAAARAEERLGDTLLLAPSFRTLDDLPTPNEPYWSSGGWKIGNESLDDPPRSSSFEVMDELLGEVCSTDHFPKLRAVVIIGHSAGGQFVNRYTAGGAGCPDPTIDVRYVVMNPSSYLYVSGLRRSADGSFTSPTDCAGYDDYKYGLGDLNAYMSRVGASRIHTNLFTRRTIYLAGEDDTSTGGDLDTSCAANLQGPNRLERHESYRQHAGLFDRWTGSTFLTVPGIGHSGSRMLMSDAAREAVFRDDLTPAQQPRLPPPTLLDPILLSAPRT